MIRINQIKLSIFDVGTDKERELRLLKERASRLLKTDAANIRKLRVLRRSIDARDKADIKFVYTVSVKLRDSVAGGRADTEAAYIAKLHNKNMLIEDYVPVTIPKLSEDRLKDTVRPVVVGMGPCGLFAALVLSRAGLKPIVIERGSRVDKRLDKVEDFLSGGRLDADCNIQFGEGGAGAFSDGKLVTSIKGRDNYVRFVLEEFYKHGAPEEILYEQKPHVGTDLLCNVVASIRDEIISLGGEVHFDTRLTGFELSGEPPKQKDEISLADERPLLEAADENDGFSIKNDSPKGSRFLKAIELSRGGKSYKMEANAVILAVGHSARDTYEKLLEQGFMMEPKPFAVGVRVQHPQELIDKALYGKDRLSEKRTILGPAAYKLTHTCEDGRGVYSFCMCPGGYVINSSSEEFRLCINGMSYHDRASDNANSAIIVSVRPEDAEGDSPLRGMELQRRLEERAYGLLSGVIPYETYGEFREGVKDPLGISSFSNVTRGYSGAADVASILPEFVRRDIIEGMEAFGKSIRGFDSEDAIISGVEARTSAPVRILRDTDMESNIRGIYPAGEGAGYAGGITSSAVDGIKAALKLIERLDKSDGQEGTADNR